MLNLNGLETVGMVLFIIEEIFLAIVILVGIPMYYEHEGIKERLKNLED